MAASCNSLTPTHRGARGDFTARCGCSDPTKLKKLMNPKKILIVDDSTIILKALSMKLKLAGYAVLTAQDGAEAVSLARREQPNLILLDISFPPDVAHGGGVAWDGFLIMNWLLR